MSHIVDTLTQLSIDPFAQDAFARERAGYLAGLAPEARAALAQPDPALAVAVADVAWSRCPGLFDPGPDPLPGISDTEAGA
ncbi:MAG TPA: hypothetical protein VNM90_03610 [Haliangium sp.]|nr:hypothetical protein [Haliangium sp.]